MPNIEDIVGQVAALGQKMDATAEAMKKSVEDSNHAKGVELENMKTELEKLNTGLTAEIDARRKAEADSQRIKNAGPLGDVKTLADGVMESPAYEQLRKAAESNGSIAFEYRVGNFGQHMKMAETFNANGFGQKATIANDSYQVPAYLANITFRPEIFGPLPRKVSMRELMPNIPTATGVVEYTVEKDWHTNLYGAAGVVIESGDTPETTIEFLDKQSSAKRIAHFIPVTRQILTDVPRLQTYLNYRLPMQLRWKEDDELINGAGGNDHVTGFLLTEGVQSYAWSDGIATDTMADAIAKAIARVTVTNMVATGIVLNPLDYTEIITTKAATSGLYLYPPSDTQTLWGLPVIQSVAIASGTALVGAFDMAAELHIREDSMIRVSDQHADFFIKNKIAMMAEERIELALTRPRAFVVVSLDSAPTS